MAVVTTERSLETLTAADFRKHQGTGFRLTGEQREGGPAGSSEVELAEVNEHPQSAGGTFRVPFSVVFRGPLEPIMPQGIYRLEHEHLGALELFIVPIGPNKNANSAEGPTAMLYEAVFG
jgi:hypothetical protein